MKFLKGEKAQGAIEYILLTGGIIVSAVMIFTIYSKMVKSAAQKLNEATEGAAMKMNQVIAEKTREMNL